MSFFTRSLFGRTVLVVVLSVLLTQLATTFVIRQFYVHPLLERALDDRANHIQTIVTSLSVMPKDQRAAFVKNYKDSEGGHILTALPKDNGIPPDPDTRLFRLQERLQRQIAPDTRVLVADRGDSPEAWISLKTPSGEYWYVTQRQRFDSGFPVKWAIMLMVVICISVVGVYWGVRRINKPLHDLTAAVHRIAQGQTPTPVPEPPGPQEIRALSEAFNTMQRALRAFESNRTIMLAGVSHDLRTPLARLRLGLEMLLSPKDGNALDPLVQDLEEIDRIIDQFLDFARDRPHYPLHLRALAPLAMACQERFVSRGIPVSLDIPPHLPKVCFNERALERILNNLLENAVRYGKPPFHLSLIQKGKAVCLIIRDHGEGIPAQEIPHLLQPFTRRESSRGGPPGSGLGLAIVARIIDLHHGTLELRSPPEGGLEVTVRLPIPEETGPVDPMSL